MSVKEEPRSLIEVPVDCILSDTALDPDDLRAVTLAQFIEGDVQIRDLTARLHLESLDGVQRSEVETEGGIGNAFDVTIDRDGVTIQNDVMDYPSYRYSHDEFRRALEQVLAALEASRSRAGCSAQQ